MSGARHFSDNPTFWPLTIHWLRLDVTAAKLAVKRFPKQNEV